MAQAGPESDRIEWLDALRGLALLGILLANILYWSGWLFMQPSQRLALAGAGGVAWQEFFHRLLIDGKFYTLFSLLFGVGFALQLERLRRRGADGVRIYRRRVLGLLLIGVIHMTLIWDGDILTLYALLGLVLPWFRAWSDRALLLVAAGLLLLPLAAVPLFTALGWTPQLYFYALSERIAEALGAGAMIRDPIGWLRGGIGHYLAWSVSGWPYSIGLRLESWRIPKVLGIMLIGLVLGRRVAIAPEPLDRRSLWLVLAAGLAVGLPFSFAYARGQGMGQQSVAAVIGTVPLAFAYAAAFLLLWPHARRLLGLLAWPGRMALTNYLAHSLIGAVLFYGVGLGLIGRLPPVGFYAVALAIFAAQLLVSRWWLARHAQGPMEALWRRMTYGKRAPAPASTPEPASAL